MRRRDTIGALLLGAVILTGCGLETSTASYRYRMSVDANQTGSAVYEILAEKTNGPLLPEEKPGGSIIRGQALIIETPGSPVFVLMQQRPGGDLVGAISRALTPDIPWNGQPNFWKAVNRLSGQASGAVMAELPREDWPLMVRFRDINDPKSVEAVDPEAIGMKRIRVETTRDPVTTGIETKLRWLDGLYAASKNNVLATSNDQLIDGLRRK